MITIACVLVILAFPTVVLGGHTFSTSWTSTGVNGLTPPPPDVEVPQDGIRLDSGASAWQFEPWAEVTSQSWDRGDIPLWNPYQGMGAPLAANFQSAVLDPLLLAVNLHPTPLTWDVSFLCAFFLGAACMYLFLRQLRLSRVAALIGMAPFIFSGYFFLYGNNHFFRSYLYLPVLLLFADRTARSQGRLAPVALGLAVAGNLLVGMPEASIYVLGALALYCLFLLAFPPSGGHRLRLAVRFGASAVLGAAVAAPLLLPGIEYLMLSFHSHDPDNKMGIFADPVKLAINWLTPHIFGRPLATFAGNNWSGVRNWVGAASVVGLIGALASPRAMRRHGGWFFLSLGTILVAKSYGLGTLRWIGNLPVLVQTHMTIFANPLIGFCVAVLVGIAAQGMLSGELSRRRFLVLSVPALAGVWALVRANHVWLAITPDNHLRRQVALALIAAGLVTLAMLLRSRRAAILMAVAVVGELLLLAPRGFQTERVDPYVRPAWVDYIISETEDSYERVFARDAKLFPNTAGAYGIYDIRSIDGLYPERFATYVKHFIQPELSSRFVGGPFGQGQESGPAETQNNPMFDLTGVRYVITDGKELVDSPLKAFFHAHPASPGVRPDVFDVDGDRREVLFMHSEARATLTVPVGSTRLSFAFALDPRVFADPETDGVNALVEVPAGDTRTVLWSTAFVPGTDPLRPEWQEVSIDLPGGISSVDLVVDPRSNSRADWAGFADLRFHGAQQYRLAASSDGAAVYENGRRIARSFVTHAATAVRDQSDALEFFKSISRRQPTGALIVETFDPARQAVVEGLTPAAARRLGGCQEPGRSTIRSYSFRHVVLDVETSCPGIVVLTDIYYPGWEARVDGRPERIYPTDIAFRGVPVEPGRSTVEFRYRPTSFRNGVGFAAVGLGSAAAMLVWPWLRRRRPLVLRASSRRH